MRLLLGTKKGAFILSSDPARRNWTLGPPILFGNIIYHFMQDPRAPRHMLIAGMAGHLGPTLYRSEDSGRTFREVKRPPAFPKAPEGAAGRTVDHTFWLTPGHRSQPGVWYAGTSPQGLFRSDDYGETWEGVSGFNDHPMRAAWCADGEQGPPDGARLHSINVDPRDANHLYIGMSSGGVFESTDAGANWAPLNRGCSAEFLPSPDAEYGHDPHCVRVHPTRPDRLYQQNHCGIYRLDRPSNEWVRIGKKMPKKIGDIGFPMVLHPRDPDTCWVFPMDGTQVWPRTSPGGKPAVYRTSDAGRSWQRLDKGLPAENAWYTVYRQAMTADNEKRVGLYFGTTGGEVWASRDEGGSWKCLAAHLPRIHSVETAA
jgi:hypothetical protein